MSAGAIGSRGPTPSSPTALVAALVLDRLAAARLVHSTRTLATVRLCTTVSDTRSVAHDPRAVAVVLESRDAEGTPTDGLIAALRRDIPTLPVLAYCDAATVASPEIVAAVHAGASGLLFRGVDDIGVAVQSAIERAREHAVAGQMLRDIEAEVPISVRPTIEHCLRHTVRSISVQDVAAALGVHRKTLVSRLTQAGMPEPRVVVGWCRLLHLAHALDNPRRSFDRIANDLDFASPTAMRNMLRRYTGLRPGEVREKGGLAYILDMFRRVLSEAHRDRTEPSGESTSDSAGRVYSARTDGPLRASQTGANGRSPVTGRDEVARRRTSGPRAS